MASIWLCNADVNGLRVAGLRSAPSARSGGHELTLYRMLDFIDCIVSLIDFVG